mmetsp:Transcript_43198/g.94165  ORF Transcript_43198/g.94165 Transcript_43198/m.94165 type:complete len:267 (+) Transcript_43198:142-942(+)
MEEEEQALDVRDDDHDIDDLCALIDDQEAEGPGDVAELLGCLSSGNSTGTGDAAAVAASLGGTAAGPLASQSENVPDLPDPALALPADIRPLPFIIVAKFDLRCEVDLKKAAFGIRHAEYNPRKQPCITVRLFDPRATALVRASGKCGITGQVDEQTLRNSAKKVARLIQRCGHDQVKFASYSVVSVLCKADVKFPVRLKEMAEKWRKNALYEPEIYCGCVFRTRMPRATYLVTAGGKLVVSGCKSTEEAHAALRRIYPVLYEFSQ